MSRRASTHGWLTDTQVSYDTVAASYADQVRDAVAAHPYLRAALELFADGVQAAGGGPVADVGCGPGHVTAYLHQLGIDAFGIDISPKMITLAQRDHPALRFEVGSMTDLTLPDAAVTGVLAWQSLIHVPDESVRTVIEHFRRVLRPGGALQLLFHVGDQPWLKTEGYGGHPMKVWVYPRQPGRVGSWLSDAGFSVDAQLLLAPHSARPQALLFCTNP